MAIAVVGGLVGIGIAYAKYVKQNTVPTEDAAITGFSKVLYNKYYVDEAYDAAVVNPIVKGSEKILWKITDNVLIDGLVNGTASVINSVSGIIRKIQTGVAQVYALVMVLGIAAALFWIILSL